jgi:hypothetical protein
MNAAGLGWLAAAVAEVVALLRPGDMYRVHHVHDDSRFAAWLGAGLCDVRTSAGRR